MLRSLVRAIFEHLLVLLVLIFVSCTLPIATVWLLKSEIGDQIVFWTSPWVVCFWSVIGFNFVGSKVWRGREAVEDWKARRGPYLWRVFKSTCWMFCCLFASYGAEFGVLWETRSFGLMAEAAYIPLALTLVWCSRG